MILPNFLRSQRLEGGKPLTKYRGLPPVRENFVPVVALEFFCRNLKDRIELFQTELRRFGHEEVDHDKGDNVESSVKAERSGDVESVQHRRESEGEHSRPEETGGDGPRHTDLTMTKREAFAADHRGASQHRRLLTSQAST